VIVPLLVDGAVPTFLGRREEFEAARPQLTEVQAR
jgi:hypothetical protein